jgi:hypothetical protein
MPESLIPYRPVITYRDPETRDIPTQYAWNPGLPTIAQTREAAINSIQANFAALNSGNAPMPYLPLAGAVSMSGQFNLAGNAAAALQPVPLQQLQSYVAANAGVLTYNGRAGAVTGTSADVTNALGYTPANAAGQAFGGAISAADISGARIKPNPLFVWSGSGAINLDWNVGMSWLINPTGAITVNAIINMPAGAIFRVFVYPTNQGFTMQSGSIVWPMIGNNVTPNLAAGPFKGALITVTHDPSFTGWYICTATCF